jgi:hypothetical protein
MAFLLAGVLVFSIVFGVSYELAVKYGPENW